MTTGEKIDALSVTINSDGWKEVILPALESVISNSTAELVSGGRNEQDKSASDDMLKGRITALIWVRDWGPRNLKAFVEQLETVQKLGEQTEQHGEGGSPYA